MTGTRTAWRLARDEEGGMTIFALFMFMSCVAIGGLALDVARFQTAVTQLQNAADAAAHAAVYSRPRMSEAEARAVAVDVATRNLPPDWQGQVITAEDIVFGDWQRTSGTFSPRTGATDAVQVTGRLTQTRGNRLKTTLLRFAGVTSWDLERTSVMRIADHDCLTEGMVSETSIEVTDSNQIETGFCLHSNGNLKIGLGNVIETGAIVSMPAPGGIWMPQSGFASNPGLEPALQQAYHKLRTLSRITEIIDGLTTPGSDQIPDYITDETVITLASRTVRTASVTPGRIHWIGCNSTQRLSIATGTVLDRVVIVTNCRVDINVGAVLEDAVLATTHIGTTSFNAPNGVRIGRNDSCAEGGGAQLITLGGIRVTSGLRVYGGQLLAGKGIEFTAATDGIEGASFMAGAEIAAGSGMTFTACGGKGMEDNFGFPSTQMMN